MTVKYRYCSVISKTQPYIICHNTIMRELAKRCRYCQWRVVYLDTIIIYYYIYFLLIINNNIIIY